MTTPQGMLAPCPFCGGSDIRLDSHADWQSPTGYVWSMCCYACGATFPNRFLKELLVEKWNTRQGREAIVRECELAARGPVYKEIYNGGDGHNWSRDSDYGKGRHAAADAVAALTPDGAGESDLCQCPQCGRMHRGLGAGKPPAIISGEPT